jgi:hypothetical protein
MRSSNNSMHIRPVLHYSATQLVISFLVITREAPSFLLSYPHYDPFLIVNLVLSNVCPRSLIFLVAEALSQHTDSTCREHLSRGMEHHL